MRSPSLAPSEVQQNSITMKNSSTSSGGQHRISHSIPPHFKEQGQNINLSYWAAIIIRYIDRLDLWLMVMSSKVEPSHIIVPKDIYLKIFYMYKIGREYPRL